MNFWSVYSDGRFKIKFFEKNSQFGSKYKAKYIRPKTWVLELMQNLKAELYFDFKAGAGYFIKAWMHNKEIYCTYTKKEFKKYESVKSIMDDTTINLKNPFNKTSKKTIDKIAISLKRIFDEIKFIYTV